MHIIMSVTKTYLVQTFVPRSAMHLWHTYACRQKMFANKFSAKSSLTFTFNLKVKHWKFLRLKSRNNGSATVNDGSARVRSNTSARLVGTVRSGAICRLSGETPGKVKLSKFECSRCVQLARSKEGVAVISFALLLVFE